MPCNFCGHAGWDDETMSRPKTPLELMNARGWFHSVDEECNADWLQLDGKTVRKYASTDRDAFESDLSECRAEAERGGWSW